LIPPRCVACGTARSARQPAAHHLLIYGLGGLIVPFIGIKAIDLLLVALKLT
jgi:K+-transporting ATPase ATPase B chain